MGNSEIIVSKQNHETVNDGSRGMFHASDAGSGPIVRRTDNRTLGIEMHERFLRTTSFWQVLQTFTFAWTTSSVRRPARFQPP
jgi:hypothetical protein